MPARGADMMTGSEPRPSRKLRVRLATLMLVIAVVALSLAVAVLSVRLRQEKARSREQERAVAASLRAIERLNAAFAKAPTARPGHVGPPNGQDAAYQGGAPPR
jgi:type II secretory pathway pseudopilin PulG